MDKCDEDDCSIPIKTNNLELKDKISVTQQSPCKTTKSGRIVKTPAYFKDFIMQ